MTIACAMILFYKPIFRFLKIDPSLHKVAFKYFSIYLLGNFFIVMNSVGLYIMNALGIGSFPFFMSIVSSVLNISGNLFFVLVLKTGVEGLAIASVISAFVVDICYLSKLKRCFKEMGVDKEKTPLNLQHITRSLSYSLPNTAQQTAMYLSSLAISPFVNAIGPAASASYSVVSKLYNINSAVYGNSARALSNYSAQCVGKKYYKKLKKGIFVGFLQGALFVTPFILTCTIFHKEICSLFFKEGVEPLAKEYAYVFAKNYLPFIYINVICNLFHGLFRGVKATLHLFSSTLIGASARFIASALLIPSMGMNGFYLGWVLSWAIEATFVLILLPIGWWNPENKKSDFEKK